MVSLSSFKQAIKKVTVNPLYIIIGVLAGLVYYLNGKNKLANTLLGNDATKATLSTIDTKIAVTQAEEQTDEKQTKAIETNAPKVDPNETTAQVLQFFNNPTDSNKPNS